MRKHLLRIIYTVGSLLLVTLAHAENGWIAHDTIVTASNPVRADVSIYLGEKKGDYCLKSDRIRKSENILFYTGGPRVTVDRDWFEIHGKVSAHACALEEYVIAKTGKVYVIEYKLVYDQYPGPIGDPVQSYLMLN